MLRRISTRRQGKKWIGQWSKHFTTDLLKVSQEVEWALKNRKPIVALESTIITHGMPYPDNLQVAKEVEGVLREEKCVPATIAVLNGKIRVGLNERELEELANGQRKASKVSRRDLPYVLSKGLNGGTTVSATMIAAHLSGIKIFATGGIGGVHRDAQNSMDISADLRELGRTPVTVVSAGVKSILDIGRTLEYLETEGVCVAVLREGEHVTRDFPAFFTARSGHGAPAYLSTPAEAAQLIAARDSLGLNSGILLAVPIPVSSQDKGQVIEEAIIEALSKAKSEGVRGKDVTPYVLSLVNKLTGGISQELNAILVANNARMAARIAVHFNRISSTSGSDAGNGSSTGTNTGTSSSNSNEAETKSWKTRGERMPVVVGASNVDIVATMDQRLDQGIHDTIYTKRPIYIGLGKKCSIASSLGVNYINPSLKTTYKKGAITST